MLLELNLAGKLTLVDGDNKEIIPGITVYTGSRHTYNSQFAVVNGFVKSMERMKTLVSDPKYIIPGHDATIFKNFPAIADGIVEIAH
jgi:hypothetical protein